jgi:hypothetical protein
MQRPSVAATLVLGGDSVRAFFESKAAYDSFFKAVDDSDARFVKLHDGYSAVWVRPSRVRAIRVVSHRR